MGLAKAMPAEKYSFAPSAAIFVPAQKTDYLSPNNQGVRTFGQMVAHVAQANYFYGGRLSGLKPDDWVVVGALQQVRQRLQIKPEPVPMPTLGAQAAQTNPESGAPGPVGQREGGPAVPGEHGHLSVQAGGATGIA